MRPTAVGIALVLLALLSSLLGCHSDDTRLSWPKLWVEEPRFDFGTLNEGQAIRHEFTVSNKGKGILRILDIRGSRSTIDTFPLTQNLRFGESTRIVVRFDSTGRWGTQDLRIVVETNDPDNLSFSLRLQGKVISDYQTEPHYLPVSRNSETGELEGSVTLKNLQDKPMVLTRIFTESNRVRTNFTPPFKAPLRLAPGQSASIDATLNAHLARNQKRDLVIVSVQGRSRPIEIPIQFER